MKKTLFLHKVFFCPPLKLNDRFFKFLKKVLRTCVNLLFVLAQMYSVARGGQNGTKLPLLLPSQRLALMALCPLLIKTRHHATIPRVSPATPY